MNLIYLIIGIIFCSISLFFLIIYLNLFTLGYTFLNFVKFIIRSSWFYLFPLGIILIYKSLERKEKK